MTQLLQATGIVLIAVEWKDLPSDYSITVAFIVLISVASLNFLMTLMLSVGACRHSRCMMITWLVYAFIAIVLQTVSGVYALDYTSLPLILTLSIGVPCWILVLILQALKYDWNALSFHKLTFQPRIAEHSILENSCSPWIQNMVFILCTPFHSKDSVSFNPKRDPIMKIRSDYNVTAGSNKHWRGLVPHIFILLFIITLIKLIPENRH